MKEISTQPVQQTISMEQNVPAPSVKKSTIDFIKQFARAYMPVPNMPGLALN